MSGWSEPPQRREQLVLFRECLDDAIGPDHVVRQLNELLARLDWSAWEASYHGRLGQPAIHPRVLASVLLYGLLRRTRSSRALEEALQMRLDFRWLAEGRSIDHTTISEFRHRHGEALKDLFVQVGLLAKQLGLLLLEQLAFDGTRMRSNNRPHGSRTPQELHDLREQLARKFQELETRAVAADVQDDEALGSSAPLSQEWSDTQQRLTRVDQALAELARVSEAGETTPTRLPLTDPESRITPNKEGGFAPNYTPLATVDVASGLIVAADVIAMTDEDHYLVPSAREVQNDFALERPVPVMLGDGLQATGANLAELESLGVTLYAPVPLPDPKNPALRLDPTQPIAESDWERLPTTVVKNKSGEKQTQLTKEAFVFDAEQDVYWCPQGVSLTRRGTTSESTGSGRVQRTRYQADTLVCAACPLRDRCLQKAARQGRQLSRDQYESHRERHVQRMATAEAQATYARRRHVGERPFAIIKQHFGARRFLLRDLAKVRLEWRWLATAFNLHRLLSLLRSRAGPPLAPILSTA